jgi:hypothetical protein
MAPQVLEHPGTRPTERLGGKTVDERILAHPRTPTEKPKTARCAGCHLDYPRRGMVIVQEGRHDSLVFFDGEKLCKPCARRNGVSY